MDGDEEPGGVGGVGEDVVAVGGEAEVGTEEGVGGGDA